MVALPTIFARSTASGRAGVAVIRISGAEADCALGRLIGQATAPPLREARLRRLFDAAGLPLDDAIVIRFPRNASFTGEEVVELHTHGAPAVVAALLDELASMDELREALPGEFTRRAFDNGRLDLAQVEALSDLLEAETEMQRRTALRLLDGGLGRKCKAWSQALTRALAVVEVSVDFVDEDVPIDFAGMVHAPVRVVAQEIQSLQAEARVEERVQTGWRVALMGAPNAGKSSLLNALARRDVAITSAIAGTTRDTVEVALDLDGAPVTIVDTAGVRETVDEIEAVGVARALHAAETADLRVFLEAPDAPLPLDLRQLQQGDDLVIRSKSDMFGAGEVSAHTGAGIAELVSSIKAALSIAPVGRDETVLKRRQSDVLRRAAQGLAAFEALVANRPDALFETPELAAEDLRSARAALGEITGETGVERLLDVVFGSFCLGK